MKRRGCLSRGGNVREVKEGEEGMQEKERKKDRQ